MWAVCSNVYQLTEKNHVKFHFSLAKYDMNAPLLKPATTASDNVKSETAERSFF